MKIIYMRLVVCILSGPPSWATASTKRSWSSTVQRKRGLGSVVRTRPESPWTHIALFSYEPFILEGFLAWNILSLWLSFSLSNRGIQGNECDAKMWENTMRFWRDQMTAFALYPSLSRILFIFLVNNFFFINFFLRKKMVIIL